jgi:ABC-type multidrug transport system fused ATPase/permease subunit
LTVRVEIREPDRPPRVIDVDHALEVGRECDGELLADLHASRRHLRLRPTSGGLVAEDLGSTHGTTVNGNPITGEVVVRAGDIVVIGRTQLIVLADEPAPRASEPAPLQAVPPAPPKLAPPQPPTTDDGMMRPQPVAIRPVVDELTAREGEAAVVRFRPGSPGEKAAPGVAAGVRRARRRLAGLGSEPWGTRPQICLVDPFPNPDHPGEVVTSGTVVDAARGEIWMVVTPEAPPEELERPLALYFGAALPAASDLGLLLEGYGLHVAGAPDVDPQLREIALPPLVAAEGELASAMARSFVAYLLERSSEDNFRRLLSSAQPGRVDAAAYEIYGAGLSVLEDTWRRRLAEGPPDVKAGQFLRLTLRYLRPHVRREAEMFVYMLFGLGFTMVFPFAFRRLLDKAIPSGEFSQVLSILTVLGVAFLISLLAGLRRAYLSAYVSGSVVRQIRIEMFGKLQTLSSGWFSRHEQGDVLSRLFSDVAVLEQGLSQTIREGAFQMLSLIVSAVVLLTLNVVLAVIVLLGAPVIALVYRAMSSGAQKRGIAVQEETGSVFSTSTENYSAQSVVKAFALEARERARFGRASERLFKAQVRMQLFGGLFGLSVNMIITFLRLFVLGLGAWLILHGHLTVGGLVAFMSLMGEVLSPVTSLTSIGQQVQASTGALVRINEVLEAAPDVVDSGGDALPPLSREIRLDGVGFSYTPERRTLDGISAVITSGTRVAFVGPTGAGKSSVLQLLMRFWDPDDGAVRFDGRDIREVSLASLRQQLGVVFQESFLFDTTIRENIALGKPGASDAEIEAAARAAEMHEFIAGLPRGYDTLVGERGGRLSGGQRQRLAIARALLRDPRVLLLDEATSALDPRTERLIAATLERVGAGRTTIAVTHRLTSIVDYDCIFVIVDGRLVEQGTHGELLARGGVYAELWAEQSGGQVPTEAPFDATGALARIPLFATLSQVELADVADRFRSAQLAAGESVREGGGRLLVVRRGRGRVVVDGLAGEPVTAAQLEPGDAFGLSALLGQDSGASLVAGEPVSLLVLDDQAIAALAATYPSVAAVLEHGATAAAAPAGGRRLTRLTMAPRGGRPLVDSGAPARLAGPTAEEIKRASGSFGAVR